MNATAKPSAPTAAQTEEPLLPANPRMKAGMTCRTARMLPPAEIIRDLDFSFRRTGKPDKAFTRTLAQALRTGGALDPILVWAEEEDGVATGRFVLLDGVLRLAAYRSVRGPDGSRKPVPAVVLSGGRKGATLAALRANSRESLPLTMQERADAAWRLVRDARCSYTVPETASAASISPRTVDSMRRRWKAMQAAEKKATGEWWQDRQDAQPDRPQEPEMTDEQREAAKNELANALRKTLALWINRDSHLVAESLRAAIGPYDLRSMTEYLFGAGEDEEDEFYNSPIVSQTGTATDPSDAF